MIKGIVRKVDELGRITLPKEYRAALDIATCTPMDFYLDGKVIHLIKGKGRKLDAVGRFTLPMEVRRTLRFEDRELVDMYIVGDEICVKRANISCVMCGSEDETVLHEVNGVLICKNCALAVTDMVMEVGL
jgi:transcriptional pleiotropic regulator of transition state genes